MIDCYNIFVEEDKLSNGINRLEKSLRRSNSLGWNFLKGMIYSFGWIAGFAILATLAIYILPKIGEGNAIGKFIHAVANIVRKNQY